MKTGRNGTVVALSLELKYCERCGGLWLRPAGGEQIYCRGCARQMADMAPASHELEPARERARSER
jgi:Zn-finger nucleic acid-binding protein